jgi:putative oxidoreductase
MKTKTTTDLGLLILRLGLGGIMLAHGLQKVGVVPGGQESLQATVEWMASMGIPQWMAYLSVLAELGGGAALIIGFLGKLAAVGIAVNMSTAIYKVHLTKGFFNADGGIEFPLALFVMAAALLVLGMGALSLDGRIASAMDRTIGGKKDSGPPPPA